MRKEAKNPKQIRDSYPPFPHLHLYSPLSYTAWRNPVLAHKVRPRKYLGSSHYPHHDPIPCFRFCWVRMGIDQRRNIWQTASWFHWYFKYWSSSSIHLLLFPFQNSQIAASHIQYIFYNYCQCEWYGGVRLLHFTWNTSTCYLSNFDVNNLSEIGF